MLTTNEHVDSIPDLSLSLPEILPGYLVIILDILASDIQYWGLIWVIILPTLF